MDNQGLFDLLHTQIGQANTILVLPHVLADGDAYGSCCAMAIYLNRIGKKVRMVAEEAHPDLYGFICDRGFFEIFDRRNTYKADLCIAMDTGDIDRLGNRESWFRRGITFNIDHHKTNTFYADYNHVDMQASSTGEIIYGYLKHIQHPIERDIATSLYVAIAADTGGFRYQNTTVHTFGIALDLVKAGIDIADISKRIFETITLDQTRLICIAINNLSIHHGGKVAIITLKNSHFRDLSLTDDMFDGLVNFARNIKNVKIAALLRETKGNQVKVSLRSNEDRYDVSKIASENQGGGHGRAAGFVAEGREIETVEAELNRGLKELVE